MGRKRLKRLNKDMSFSEKETKNFPKSLNSLNMGSGAQRTVGAQVMNSNGTFKLVEESTSIASIKRIAEVEEFHVKNAKRRGFRVMPLEVRNKVVRKIELNAHLPSTPKFKEAWKKGRKVSEGPVHFDPLPFHHVVISKLILDHSFLAKLGSELLQLPYERMSNDLYSFYQTDSLFDLPSSFQCVKDVLELITGPLRHWVGEVTGKKFSEKVTATASQYHSTDRLLCHDDNLCDRSVAFILYLCKDWDDSNDGGSLDLFECDSNNQPRRVGKSVFPKYGSFVFFEVSKHSYHQVAEVTSHKQRLSINGWYHGEDLPEPIKWAEPLPKMIMPSNPKGCSIQSWVRPEWLETETLNSLRESFRSELYLSIGNFLREDVYYDLLEAVQSDSIKWSVSGPANKRRFELAQVASLPTIWKDFLNLLRSRYWYQFLSKCTVDIDPDSYPRPKCFNELQHWRQGDYTLLVDDDSFNKMTGMDVYLYFGVSKSKKKEQDGGEVYYFGPERDETGYLEQKDYIPTDNNHLFIMARIEGMGTITKYVDHQINPFYRIYSHYSQSLD